MNSIVTRVLAWLSPAHVAALNASGNVLEADGINIIDQVVQGLKTAVVATEGVAEATPIGALIVGFIKDAQNSSLSNSAKLAAVVEQTVPFLVTMAATGGTNLVASNLTSLGTALVQNVYNAEISTTAGAAAVALAPVLGIKLPAPKA